MNTVIVPLANGRALALDLASYQTALERGRALLEPGEPAVNGDVVEVLDAAGMEQRTGVPASWWLEAARRKDVPHIRAGKYVRFNLREALTALESR